MRPCACTIAARAMLPSAAVVARSFAAQHPDIPFVTLLADTPAESGDPLVGAFPGELLALSALGRPDLLRRAFRTAQQPFSYALTGALLTNLLDRGHDAVIFYKQESLIVGRQDAALERLRDCAVLLTPHLLDPAPSADAAERERTILLAGVYNLGFLGVSDHPEARRFLDWWDERLDEHCRHDVAGGMHFEQRWIDLVPSLFADVAILRDPAYNVGHWNITERRISADPAGEHVRTAGRPCALVRFSGYDPETPERATRYTDRVLVADLGSARRLFERYRRELLEAGWAQALDAEYGFAVFADGVPVPDVARAMLRSLPPDKLERFGDPFSIGPDSFRAWMTAPVDEGRPRISRLLRAVHACRGDLRDAFPDPLGEDRTAFAGWARRAGSQLGIGPELDPPAPSDRDMVAVTVATPDRLPYARVLADSLRRHHPDLALRVVVVGAPSCDRAYATEPFEPLDCADLGLDELDVLLLGGMVADAVTQAKPAALDALLALGHECVLYVDADTQAVGDLGPLLDAVRSHPVVLLPHSVDPPSTPPDLSRELLLLKAGTMNAGVVGVRAGPQATAFLRWWNDRLRAGLTSDADAGVYYDQRWLDLAPGMFDGVHVLRDARFDVGPWNVRERRDVDWRLMHHSGFDPDQPDVIWGHAPSARFDDVEAVGPVYARYAQQLRAAGLVAGAGRRPGAAFADGTAVPEPVVQIAAALGLRRRRFGNLLDSGPGSFQAWLAEPADDGEPAVVRLWYAIHGLRDDLRAAFPEPLGADRESYVHWCRSHGIQEHPVDPAFAP